MVLLLPAFVLPVAWFFAGPAAVSQLRRLSSLFASTGMLLMNWKMKTASDLGIPVKTVSKLAKTPFKIFIYKMLKKDLPEEEGENVYVFDLTKDSVSEFPWLAQKYCLFGTEYENLMDGIRHLYLLKGVGPESDQVRAKIKEGVEYEDMSFLWEGFGCNFKRLQDLSKERLRSSFLKAVGIVPESA